MVNHPDWGGTGKTLLEITDPDTNTCGGLCAGFVYTKGDVLFTIITDDTELLLAALIELP